MATANVGLIRDLTGEQIEELLRTAIVGRIACCAHGADGSDGRPYVVPLAYGYDGEAIYAHSGIGHKIRMMRAQPLVTVEVDEATAPDRWRSVIAEGEYHELSEPADRERAMAIIYPNPAHRPSLPADTIIYRIRLTAKSGRYEVPGDDLSEQR
jgi:nitroimidazol reductase NimA-like FMN-containing flavoprotein (pyridoxamine 5'-phosphate oxidase superfamily)